MEDRWSLEAEQEGTGHAPQQNAQAGRHWHVQAGEIMMQEGRGLPAAARQLQCVPAVRHAGQASRVAQSRLTPSAKGAASGKWEGKRER